MLEHRIQKAVLWAEDHLLEDFSSGDLAQIACLSEYHFRRIFMAMTGISPGLYIKRRRLSRAAEMLADSDQKIIDIALNAGFESQESFSRAFKEMFRITPAQHRKTAQTLSHLIQPAMDQAYFNHLQQGAITMTPDIRTRDQFCVAGIGDDFIVGETGTIPQLWDQFLLRRNDLHPSGRTDYGICGKAHGETAPANTFHYTAATAIDENTPVPPGMERILIPKNTYAVFTHKGPISTFEKTVQFIWKIWLPKSPYTVADSPDFELYDHRFNPDSMTGEIEVWVPIKV